MRLLLHGVPDTGAMWAPVLAALGDDATAVETPTMPGFDGRLPPGFAATAETYADWLVGRLDAAPGPVDLVGHDWGAGIAAMAAVARPGRVRSLALMNAVPEPTYRWHRLARVWQTPVLGEVALALGTRGAFARALTSAGMPAEMAAAEAGRIDAAMKRAILRLYRSARVPVALDMGAVADRTAVIWGAEDPFVPLAVARIFADRWSLPLSVEEGVGHWGLLERPRAFAEHLRAHWRRV